MLAGIPKPKARKRPGKNEPVIINDCTLYLGDCLEILPTLGKVDAVVTDPPYGVDLGHKPSALGKTSYNEFDDTPEYVACVVVPTIVKCTEISDRSVLTPGIRNMFKYPTPSDVGGVYCPAGGGNGRWGFTCFHPILYYGTDPYLKAGSGSQANAFRSTDTAEKNGHPCPKPLSWMIWMVKRASFPGHLVLDPFMGSGTTGVACVKLGRKFIGIEIDPEYFDIACKRIEKAYSEKNISMSSKTPLLGR